MYAKNYRQRYLITPQHPISVDTLTDSAKLIAIRFVGLNTEVCKTIITDTDFLFAKWSYIALTSLTAVEKLAVVGNSLA